MSEEASTYYIGEHLRRASIDWHIECEKKAVSAAKAYGSRGAGVSGVIAKVLKSVENDVDRVYVSILAAQSIPELRIRPNGVRKDGGL